MHHNDAIAHAQHFRHLRRDENDAQAIGFKLVNQLVDFFLRPDVDAAGRFIEDQHFRPGHQPASDSDFLLVTAGKQADCLLH